MLGFGESAIRMSLVSGARSSKFFWQFPFVQRREEFESEFRCEE